MLHMCKRCNIMQCPQRKNKSIKGRVEAVNILRDTLWNQTAGMRKQVLTLLVGQSYTTTLFLNSHI